MGTSIIKTVTMEEQGLIDDEYGLGYVGSISTNTYCFTSYIPNDLNVLRIDDFFLDRIFNDLHALTPETYQYQRIVADWINDEFWDGDYISYNQTDSIIFLKDLDKIYRDKLQHNNFEVDGHVWMPKLCTFVERQIRTSGGISICEE